MAIKYLDAGRIRGLNASKTETKVGQAGETQVWANASIGECSWKKITGLTAGDPITHMVFDIYDWSTAEGKFALYTDGDDDLPEARIGNVVTATLTQVGGGYLDTYYTAVYVATSGSPVVPSDGIVWVGIMRNSGSFLAKNFPNSPGNALNSVYDSSVAYGDVFPSTVTASSGGGNSYRFGVRTTGGDTKPTNVSANTIFEQTDNYKYQYFNGTTWTGQPSTNIIAFGSTDHQTETWDGISWSLRGDLPVTKRELGGGGSTTDALAIGGYSTPEGTPYATTTTYEWNGSAWSSGGALTNPRRNIGDSGGGNSGTGWVSGGQATVGGSFGYTDKMEVYSGSSWSAGGDMTAALGKGVGGGLKTNCLYCKELTAQTYNGTAWSNTAALSNANSNVGSKQGGGDGNADNCMAAGGEGGGGSSGNATSYISNLWNGTAWSQGASLPSSSPNQAGFGDCQGAGNKDKYVHIQGSQGGGSAAGVTSSTYIWDGSAWTRGADCNSKRTQGNAGMGDV